MTKVSRDFHDAFTSLIDDTVSYSIQEAFKQDGELISGETAWNILLCRATAKVLEFEGHFVPDNMDMGGDVTMKLLLKEEDTTEDTEHF